MPLFTTSVIDTSGTGVVDTGGKLPPVLTTLSKLVAKWPPVLLVPVVQLDLHYLCEFLNKIVMVLMGYSGAGGKLIHEKNQKQKSRDTVPLN